MGHTQSSCHWSGARHFLDMSSPKPPPPKKKETKTKWCSDHYLTFETISVLGRVMFTLKVDVQAGYVCLKLRRGKLPVWTMKEEGCGYFIHWAQLLPWIWKVNPSSDGQFLPFLQLPLSPLVTLDNLTWIFYSTGIQQNIA